MQTSFDRFIDPSQKAACDAACRKYQKELEDIDAEISPGDAEIAATKSEIAAARARTAAGRARIAAAEATICAARGELRLLEAWARSQGLTPPPELLPPELLDA